jgi:hypothetical protein
MRGKLSFFGNPWLSYTTRCDKIDYGGTEFSRPSKTTKEPISHIAKDTRCLFDISTGL